MNTLKRINGKYIANFNGAKCQFNTFRGAFNYIALNASTPEVDDRNIRNLAAAIMLQAARDFVNGDENERRNILKDLYSHRMDFITEGMAPVVAEQLELHPEDIADRMRQHHEIV